MKTLYCYDPVTGAYTGTFDPVFERLLSDNPQVVQANSTDIKPEFIPGTWPVFDIVWSNPKDNRGTVFNTMTNQFEDYQELGALPPHLTKKPKPDGLYLWDGQAWIFDLNAAIKDKIMDLEIDYAIANQADIIFITRPFQMDNKSRGLLAEVLSVVDYLPDNFAWLDSLNVPVPMDSTTIKQFGGAVLARGYALFSKLQTLKASARMANDQQQLDLIFWD